jgi:hypothetical protein
MEYHDVEGGLRIGHSARVAFIEAQVRQSRGQFAGASKETGRRIETGDGVDPRPTRQLPADRAGAAASLEHDAGLPDRPARC